MSWRSNLTPQREWTLALLVLAARRAEPLWAAAGVPDEIRRDPSTAIGAAREVLLIHAEASPPSEFLAALRRAFERIDTDYGAEAADALDTWARRHFVRAERRDAVDAWTDVFNAVTALPDRWLSSFSTSGELRARLAADLARSFREPYARAHDLERQAHALPATPLEQEVLRLDPPHDDDHTEFPAIDLAMNTVARELGIATWRRLDAAYSASEVETIVGWARALAPTLRVDGTLLRHPIL